jgi:hypothetical protein
MSRPASREELLARITTDFERLMEAVEQIDPRRHVGPSDYPRGSIKDVLAHLHAWHEIFLGWERVGRRGQVPEMPAPGYTWRDTPALNLGIHERHEDDSWESVMTDLRGSHARVRAVIEAYGADELFEKKRYAWTGSTSVGSYAVSATTSHYDWAGKHLRKSLKAWSADSRTLETSRR